MSFKKKNKTSTTKLPAALRDELGIAAPSGGGSSTRGGRNFSGPSSFRGRGGGRRPGSVIGRKDARKAERDSKKQRPSGNSYISEKAAGKKRQADDEPRARKTTASQKKPRLSSRQDEDDDSEELGDSESDSDSPAPNAKMTPLQRMLDKSQAKARPSTSAPKRKSNNRAHLTQTEKDEEDEIAWLEAMLGGAGKSSGKGKKSAADEDAVQETDGFDDLLDDLDRFYPGMYEGGDDGEESDEESEGESEEVSEAESEFDEEASEMDDLSGFSEEDVSEDGDSAGDDSAEKAPGSQAQTEAPAATAPPLSTGKYIPPAARAAAAAAASTPSASASTSASPSAAQQLEQQKLRRQLQGLLNRLGDSNLDSILNSLEDVYRVNRRAEVSTLLARLILDTIAMRSNLILTDTFVVVYASLVASLGRIVGMEFVAGLVSELVTDLLKFYRQAKEDEVNEVRGEGDAAGSSGSSKALANLVVLLSHMYNLHVVACPLVYDLIKLFLGEVPAGGGIESATGEMSELDVESLLKVVKTCGTQLRSDDASSLKQIASIATTKTASTSKSGSQSNMTVKSSSRTRFMLETLNNLNKTSGGSSSSGDNTSASQMLGQMKKYLGTMEKKRSTRRWEPLRIGLKDLHDADRRGKWWLVGAVWKDEEQAGLAESELTSKRRRRREVDADAETEQDSQLAQLTLLARQHGMNTPARRQIFTTIMSSPDYVTAASDLLTLSLTAVQQREIIRVLLHCTARESTYNPYYSLIGMQLAQGEMKKGISITIQFCLWDYLRSIGEKSVGGQSVAREDDDDGNVDFDEEDTDTETQDRKMWNLSRCYAFWISRSTIDLTILRPIPFASLRSSKAKKFLQLFFLHLLLSSQTTSPTLTPKSGDWSKESKKRSNLEKIFISATTNNLELLMGLHLFFGTEMGSGSVAKLVGGGKKGKNVSHAQAVLQERVDWCVGVVREILDVGLQSARRGWAGV